MGRFLYIKFFLIGMEPFFNNKPQKMSEIIGQDKALDKVNLFFKNFTKGTGLFLYGPIGSGKTSTIYAFAKENDYDILELNASDARNKTNLDEFLSKATGQMSLFARKKIILLDEIDGLSGMKDRGAAKVIEEYIKKSQFPIVVTGMNAFDKKVAPIKKSSLAVCFGELKSSDVVIIINNVINKENINLDSNLISKIARECAGDARAALNDVFYYALIQSSDIGDEEISNRVGTDTIANALTRVLKSKDMSVVLGAYDNVEEDLDKIFLWLDYNMPKEYLEVEDLSKAFDELALADRFFGRIRKWQYYRFYVYCYQLLSAGIALAKKVKYSVPPKYNQSTRLLKYWQANITYAKRKSIVAKIAEKTHSSAKRVMRDVLPLLRTAISKNKDLAEEFDLSSEEISWIKKI